MGQTTSLLRLRWVLALLFSLVWATMGKTASLAERRDFGRCDFAANSAGASSRLAPGGGLLAHENAVGHVMSRHVGQTDA